MHLRSASKLKFFHTLLRTQTRGYYQTKGFQVLDDTLEKDETLPQFMVGIKNGFLPRTDPLETLPPKYAQVEKLLQEMPLITKNGPGLLAQGKFGEAVLRDLPLIDLSNETNTRLQAALMRDYSFLASAYLLEPCDIKYKATGEYGLGRDVLPKQIAVPLVKIAELTNAKPFMEYAFSYALINYRRLDPKGPHSMENLRTIRLFTNSPDEQGFILVHVAMVSHSGRLVKGAIDICNAAEKKDRKAFDQAMTDYYNAMLDITNLLDTMWKHSDPNGYNFFRTFIMGIKNQPMFPNGVIYEGVSDKPMSFRGESGANDSIVPTSDNLFEVTKMLPHNPLTDMLKDFRTYRPPKHSDWVEWVEKRATEAGVYKFAMADTNSSVLYLANLDRIRYFRNVHWSLTKAYIIAHTDHPVATGGTPITTWLPNQLGSVMKIMSKVEKEIDRSKIKPELQPLFNSISEKVDVQIKVLNQEVDELSRRYKNQNPTSA